MGYTPPFSDTALVLIAALVLAVCAIAWWQRHLLLRLWSPVFDWLGAPRQQLMRTLANLRWPLLTSLIVTAAFLFSDQTHEVLARMAEDLRTEASAETFFEIVQAFLSGKNVLVFVLLILFCVTLMMNSLWLLDARDPDHRQDGTGQNLAVLIALLPMAGLLVGSLIASMSDVAEGLTVPLLLLPGIMAAIALFIVYLLFGQAPHWSTKEAADIGKGGSSFLAALREYPVIGLVVQLIGVAPILKDETHRRVFRISSLAVAPIVLLLFIASPVALPQSVGPAGVLFLCALGLSSMLCALSRAGDFLRLPVIALFVVVGMVFSLLDWTDNHIVRQMPVANAAQYATPAQAFEEWSAPLRDATGKVDGPVYVVAAQGGGLYAATHTALFLARIEDRQSKVPQPLATSDRIFALSGVSGGSVGIAVFEIVRASRVCDRANNPQAPERDCHAQIISEILSHDFLAPVLGSFLTTDLAARLLPAARGRLALPGRADTLERSFKRAIVQTLIKYGVSEETADEVVNLPVASANPSAGRINRPVFLFNTTDVDTGERVVITNLNDIDPRLPRHLRTVRTWHDVSYCPDTDTSCPVPSMLTAALISARFPYVTPAASLYNAKGVKLRLVDGGYYENSGTETLHDLVGSMRTIASQVQFQLIALDFDPIEDDEVQRAYWAGETLSPIRAMLAARSARGELPKRRSEFLQSDLWRHATVRLDRHEDSFTLGWVLSQRGIDEIGCHIWDNQTCRKLGVRITPTMDLNRCVIAQLHLQQPTSTCR